MPHGLKDIELTKLNEVFAANERIERVVLYGSRAKGNYKPFSDVDITLEGPELTHTDLSRLSLAIDDLLLPYQFDISIFHTLKNEALIDHIRRMGITIYEKKSDWKEYKLGEIADVQTGPFGSQLHMSDYQNEGTPIITVEHLGDNRIIHNNLPLVGDDDKNRLKKYVLAEGDIVFSRVGSVDRRAYVSAKENGWMFSGRCLRVRPSQKADAKFLSYYFGLEDFKETIRRIAVGATMPSINTTILSNVVVPLPPLDTQRRIAAILSSLDDKIDLLHRENATLEQMAETMFRQWFVVEAKEEWEEGKLGDILTVKGGTTPSTKEPNFWDGEIAWTSPRDVTTLKGLYLYETEKKITQKGLEQISSGLLPAGTLLMSSRAPVGVLAFAEIPVAINQGYIAILDDKDYSKEFIYLWLKTNMELVHSYSNGSTFMEISKSAFKSLDVLIPSKKEVDCFVQEVKPYFEKIRTNEIQIRTLTKTRDGLLPKLMGGELKI